MLGGIWGALKAFGAIFTLANKIADGMKARREREQGKVEQVVANQSKVIQDDRKANEARTAADRDSAAGKLRDDDGFRRD